MSVDFSDGRRPYYCYCVSSLAEISAIHLQTIYYTFLAHLSCCNLAVVLTWLTIECSLIDVIANQLFGETFGYFFLLSHLLVPFVM